MDFEFEVLDAINSIRTPWLDEIMKFISSLGNAGIIWIIFGITLLIFPKTRNYGTVVLVAMLIDLVLCNGLIKNIVARKRPFVVRDTVELIIKKPLEYSFPSGHTAVSFSAVFALIFAKEKRMWKYAIVLAGLIAFSRMYLYVHFPTDILGGIAVGILAGFLGNLVAVKLLKLGFPSCYTDKNGEK